MPGILLLGDFGTGKSTFVMTLGKRLQMLCLNRGDWGPARSYKDTHTDSRQQVDIVECHEDLGKPGSGLQKTKDQLFKISEQIANKTYPFAAVCLDNLTTLGDQCMRSVLNNSGRFSQGMLRTNATDTGIQIQHWGLAMVELENCITVLKNLPLLRICIAHTDTETVDGNTQKIVSVIGNKLTPKIPTFFDEVWYSIVAPQGGGGVKFVIQTVRSGSIPARSRYGAPNGAEMSLGLPAILEKIGYKL